MSAPPLSVLRHLARLNLNFSIPSRADFTVPIRIPRPGNLALSSGLIGIFALWGSTIWDSVLRAVPKKKTSYSKKRNRFLHNNKLTDITHVVSCPACGTPKKMHTLCPYCVEGEIEYLSSSRRGG